MAENVRWNHPNGSGGFTELNLPSSAEIVDYDGGSVKDALDNIEGGNASNYVKTLLNAEDAFAARSIIVIPITKFRSISTA